MFVNACVSLQCFDIHVLRCLFVVCSLSVRISVEPVRNISAFGTFRSLLPQKITAETGIGNRKESVMSNFGYSFATC